MSDPIQLAPTMAIFEDDGDFTVRVNDSPLAKSLTPVLLKAIGEVTKARKLTILTPTETKIFRLNGNPGTPHPPAEPTLPAPTAPTPPKARARISQDAGAPPAPEIAAEAMDEYDQQLAEAQEAERQQREMERMNSQDANLRDTPPEAVEEAPKPRKRSPRPEPVSNSICGRCGGAGSIGEGTCPVCRGTGQIVKWGSRR